MDFFAEFFSTASTAVTAIAFLVGLVLIIKGGDWFVDSASWIAEVLGVPKFVIGATIVSLATTLPELIVSISATAQGNVEMAAGNAIGSVTANTALILGLFTVCMPFAIKRKEFSPKALLMLGASVALFLGCVFATEFDATYSGEAGRFHSLSTVGLIALMGIFIVFFAENYISMKNSNTQIEPSPQSIGIQNEDEIVPTKENTSSVDWAKRIALFALGAGGIVLGAQLLVNSGTELATRMNVPQRVISIVAIAIGTSLPELVTTITAIRKKEGALSVGNILGANIIDLTLILPICSVVSMAQGNGALAVSYQAVRFDMIACIVAIAIAVVPTIITKKFSRWQGIATLSGYLAYVAYTVFM